MAVDHCAWDGTQPLAVICMVWVILVLAAPYGLYSWSDMCFLLFACRCCAAPADARDGLHVKQHVTTDGSFQG